MNAKYKFYIFVLRIFNKLVSLVSDGRKKLSISDSAEISVDYQKIKDFIYRPTGINYSKKILFLDKNYGNLQSIYKLIGNKYSDYALLKSDSDFDAIKKIYNYKIIVINSDLGFLDKVSKKNQLVVCVWHALGAFKKVGKYNTTVWKNENERNCYESFFDFLIVSGTEIISLYADAFNIDKKNVLALGLPQIDKYFNSKLQKEKRKKFIQKFNFLKNKKIYGFFPTFQEKKFGIYWNINFKKLASFLKNDEIIVFKLHPSVPMSNTDFYEIKDKIINLSDIDDLIYLCQFESIITDYSSIIFEAMILDINLVFFRNKKVEQERDLWTNYEDLPGNILNFNTSKKINLEKNIIENLRTKFDDKSKYKNFYNKNIGCCDAKSSERIAKFLLEKLKQ